MQQFGLCGTRINRCESFRKVFRRFAVRENFCSAKNGSHIGLEKRKKRSCRSRLRSFQKGKCFCRDRSKFYLRDTRRRRNLFQPRSEERRVGKEGRSRWS